MSRIKTIKYTKKNLSKLVIHPEKLANKYSRGICYLLCGSNKYPGAAVLASLAASKSGSGYTKLYTVKENVLACALKMPSVVCDTFESLGTMKDKLDDKPSAFVVGPGFEVNNEKNTKLILKVLRRTKAPVVIDGGALSNFSALDVRNQCFERHKLGYTTILTPHLGEANALLSAYSKTKFDDVKKLAYELSVFSGAIIVLKGPKTIICDAKKVYEMHIGSPALAKAGTGDVLAGILGGILCQNKIDAFDACALATNLHAKSANLAVNKLTDISILPEDIIEFIHEAYKAILK